MFTISKSPRIVLSGALAVAVLAISAGSGTSSQAQALPKVRLQLKWVTQAQFAGYYAAAAQGYYKDQGLDVEIKVGGPDINPEQVVASGGADFGIDWVPSLLSSRENGENIVDIAQVYARSGMREVSFKNKNIGSVTDLKGKNVGVWLGGNEFELFAALVKNNLDPQNPADLTIIKQPFDMSLLLNGQVDAAAAMTYNEYAQVMEAVNPATGKLYSAGDLNLIDFNQAGTAMLEDNIFAGADWLAKSGNEDIAVKFLAASFKGWAYARDHVTATAGIVVSQGTALGMGHQIWQLNEVNKLIWPNSTGIGVLDPAAFQQTADISLKYKVISKAPDAGAYRTDLATKALALLGPNFDAFGKNYTPLTVVVSAGGTDATVSGGASATMSATMAGTMSAAMPAATMAATTSY